MSKYFSFIAINEECQALDTFDSEDALIEYYADKAAQKAADNGANDVSAEDSGYFRTIALYHADDKFTLASDVLDNSQQIRDVGQELLKEHEANCVDIQAEAASEFWATR